MHGSFIFLIIYFLKKPAYLIYFKRIKTKQTLKYKYNCYICSLVLNNRQLRSYTNETLNKNITFKKIIH